LGYHQLVFGKDINDSTSVETLLVHCPSSHHF